MNTSSVDPDEADALLRWFDAIWNEQGAVRDDKVDLLTLLRNVYESKSPELIYYLTLHSLFRDYLGELDEENIIKTRTGIKDTAV